LQAAQLVAAQVLHALPPRAVVPSEPLLRAMKDEINRCTSPLWHWGQVTGSSAWLKLRRSSNLV